MAAPKPQATNHVNPAPVPEVSAIPAEGSGRQRGPVEEVIAKRMKQIGKKLQRYRTYISADPTTLNADQKAALVSLPALEGAYKELEDLVRDKGPVEEQELIQAAKLREATEAAKAAAIAEASSSTEQYKASLVRPLSLFLRLYALLHPARPEDHEHLTFSALSLPPRLQDEVRATDVLRVGRLYEDLTTGGEAATAVLDSLVRGLTGEDEENDHIHHLLDLLAQPDQPIVESVPLSPTQTAEAHEDFTAAALAGSADEAIEAVPEAVVPEEQREVLSEQVEHDHPISHQPPTLGAINFLQDDELEARTEPDQGPVEVEAGGEQTSALISQPETPALTREARDFAPVSAGDWADLDDEDVAPAQPAVNAATSVEKPIAGAAETVEPETTDVSATSAATPGPSSKKPRGGKNGAKSGGRGRGQGQGQGQGQGRQQRQTSQSQGRGQAQSGGSGAVGTPGQKLVDEDGFELKVRKGVPPAQTTSTQSPTGRGGARGGRGGSASRGGRGRGGSNGARTPSGPSDKVQGQGKGKSQTKKEGAARPSQQPQQSQQGQDSKPKASIYKAVQPTGPTSAPIL